MKVNRKIWRALCRALENGTWALPRWKRRAPPQVEAASPSPGGRGSGLR